MYQYIEDEHQHYHDFLFEMMDFLLVYDHSKVKDFSGSIICVFMTFEIQHILSAKFLDDLALIDVRGKVKIVITVI